MIRRESYDTRRNIDNLLDQYATIYSIESIEDGKLRYGVKNGTFAVMRLGDAYVCDICEMPELAEYFIDGVKKEILAIYDDVKSLGLERVW